MATRNSSVEDNGDAEALPVNLVSYKEDSSGSEKEEEEDEYIVPRKKPRLDQDKNGNECNWTMSQGGGGGGGGGGGTKIKTVLNVTVQLHRV